MTVPQLLDASTDSLETTGTPGPEKTLILLDWDDTLLSSTWLSMNDLRLDSPDFLEPVHRNELQQLEMRVANFLEKAVTLGEVMLVTNAERGWIELSCEKFIPGVAGFLSRVKVVSARTSFEELYPNQPSQWKIQAFRKEIHSLALTTDHCNVISIGDSNHEREALHVVTNGLDNVLVKSVKFVERPGIEVLRKQLELILGSIEYIAQHNADLDLMLSQSLMFSAEQKGEHDMDAESQEPQSRPSSPHPEQALEEVAPMSI